MNYSITQQRNNRPLNIYEHLGKFYLTNGYLVNSAYIAASVSDAIEVATGHGDGSKEKPILDLDLGDVNLMTVEEDKVKPFDRRMSAVNQPKSGDYKIFSCDVDPFGDTVAPSVTVYMYAKTLRQEIKSSKDKNVCILRLSRAFCDSYKVGDKVYPHSGYSQRLFSSYTHEIIDEVNLELLDENRGIDTEKYSYWIAKKLY